MVKLDDLPTEKGRIELEQLKYFMEEQGGKIEMIATGEDWQEGSDTKTGGLKIHLRTRENFSCNWDFTNEKKLDKPIIMEEGLAITQLYGKQGSKILTNHLEALDITDTEELQKSYFEYRLRQQRTGFSRLYPVERVKE